MKRMFSLFLIFFSTSLSASTPQEISLGVKDAGTFEVFFSRAKSTVTGAVIGGLIGAAIQSGIEEGKDDDRTAELQSKLKDSSCSGRIVESMYATLEKKGYLVNLTEEKSYPRMDIDVEYCGFKVVNSQTDAMSAFARLTAEYQIEKGKVVQETFLLMSKSEVTYQELVSEGYGIDLELTRVLEKTGRRLANKIIYHY